MGELLEPPVAFAGAEQRAAGRADSGAGGISYRAQLALTMTALVLVSAAAVSFVAFASAASSARALADSLFREASSHAVTRARNHVLGVAPLVSALSRVAPETLALNDSNRLGIQLAEILRANEGLTWLSFSDESGRFTGANRTAEGTIRLNQSHIENGKTRRVDSDVLADNSLRPFRTTEDTGYDPRKRPFYQRAKNEGRVVWVPPYVFFGDKVPGITAAAPIRDASGKLLGVMTADFDLNALSAFVGRISISNESRFFLFTADGVVLAHPGTRVVSGANTDAKLLELKDVENAVTRAYLKHLPRDAANVTGGGEHFVSFGFREGNVDYLASATAFRVDEGLTWIVGALAPENDFLGSFRRGQNIALAVACGAVLMALLVAALLSRRVSRPVVNLIGFMRRVGEGELESKAELSGPREFRTLSRSLNHMIDDLRDHVRMRDALNIAMDVQQRLLPASPPAVDGLDIAGHSTYCDETGGDYYDFLVLDRPTPGTTLVALGDVMGHGVAAALVMASVRAVLRDRATESGTLAELMGRLNELIYADLGGTRFMTMYLALVDARQRTFRWCSAGHDPAIVYDPSRDAFDEVDEAGFPLGVVPGNDGYTECSSTTLSPGQVILIGTDGIWEAQDMAGEQFGKERLRDMIRAAASEPASEIVRRVLKAVLDFRGSAGASDDITFVVLKMTGAASADAAGLVGGRTTTTGSPSR
jgi:serine phosphatase RsbU (regulator of sigma subunit)